MFIKKDLFWEEIFGGFNKDVKVLTTEKGWDIIVLKPGLKKDDIKINIESSFLVVDYETSDDSVFDKTPFNLRFNIPATINLEKIEAEYVDGVLKISLMKDPKKTTEIKIK